MKNYELVNAKDCLGNDNDGYIYGITWIDGYGDILDCEWFKTKAQRSKALIKTKALDKKLDKQVNEVLNRFMKGTK